MIDAPWEVTEEMVRALNISVVVHGTVTDSENMDDPYKVLSCSLLSILVFGLISFSHHPLLFLHGCSKHTRNDDTFSSRYI